MQTLYGINMAFLNEAIKQDYKDGIDRCFREGLQVFEIRDPALLSPEERERRKAEDAEREAEWTARQEKERQEGIAQLQAMDWTTLDAERISDVLYVAEYGRDDW